MTIMSERIIIVTIITIASNILQQSQLRMEMKVLMQSPSCKFQKDNNNYYSYFCGLSFLKLCIKDTRNINDICKVQITQSKD